MIQKHIVAILATSIVGFAAATASAQNPNFAENTGQIVMGFQGINGYGGLNVVEVALGTAASYRDASSPVTNITNIGALLTSTFGADWYENANLFAGIATATSNANPPADLINGDPDQTLYLSKTRTLNLGDGQQAVSGSTINTLTGSSIGASANSLLSLQGRIEGTGTEAAQAYVRSQANTWEDQNQTSAAGVQSFAYGINGGIQSRFGAGTASNGMEANFDLYRFQRANDIAGQYGEGDATGVGEYQGYFTLDSLGNVSFLPAVVPEPSTALGLGATALLGMVIRRRRTVAA